jgi:hypothetical protein
MAVTRVLAVLALTIAAALALPESGQIGQITAVADDEDYPSCYVEEEKEEDGEAEEDEKEKEERDFTTAKCLDICASNGYIFEQTNKTSTTVADEDGGDDVTTTYYNLKMTPVKACIGGCGCPAGRAFAEDEDGETAPEKYEVIFSEMDNSLDTDLFEGQITVVPEDGDGAEAYVTFETKYYVIEKREEDDGRQEERKEEEECVRKFSISKGTISGNTVNAEVPEIPTFAEGEFQGSIDRYGATTSNCSFQYFAVGTPDYCKFKCMDEFSVGTKDNSIMFVPTQGYISHDCICNWGIGFQNKSGPEFPVAQVDFTDHSVCTPSYSGNISYATVEDSQMVDDVEEKFFSISVQMSDRMCVFKYNTEGWIMGKQSDGKTNTGADSGEVHKASQGMVILSIILSIVAIVGFCGPCFMKGDKE